MLRIFDELPPGILERDSSALADALGGPSLIRLAGERPQPLLVATLLHGNETTGWDALRQLLSEHRNGALPRSLLLFIGNVAAAREGLRHLDGQPDFNRIWCDALGPEAAMAARVLAEARRAEPVACIDVHNTSGQNPVYACVHRVDESSLALARHFSATAVLVTHPESLLSMALAPVAPSVTLECGKPGNAVVTRQIARSLRDLMTGDPLPHHRKAGGEVKLLRTVARVRVPDQTSFSFDDSDADLRFVANLDHHNFSVMPAGTLIARLGSGAGSVAALSAVDEHGVDVSGRFFRRSGDALVTTVPWIPSLFSANERIVRQDCLCYVMEPI